MDPICDGLWEFSHRIKYAGVGMPTRSVVIRLSNGDVLVHSPGQLDDQVRDQLAELGPVKGLIAPNKFHHLYVSDWQAAYPDATLFIAPVLADKRKDLADAPRLSDEAPALWADEMEQLVWGGIPKIGEVVFYHKPSRTLLNTDMMHNMHNDPSWWSRFVWKRLGAYGRFGPSKMERRWTKDHAGLKQSLERVLDWDFNRVTVAHGDVFESPTAKDELRAGWHWV